MASTFFTKNLFLLRVPHSKTESEASMSFLLNSHCSATKSCDLSRFSTSGVPKWLRIVALLKNMKCVELAGVLSINNHSSLR